MEGFTQHLLECLPQNVFRVRLVENYKTNPKMLNSCISWNMENHPNITKSSMSVYECGRWSMEGVLSKEFHGWRSVEGVPWNVEWAPLNAFNGTLFIERLRQTTFRLPWNAVIRTLVREHRQGSGQGGAVYAMPSMEGPGRNTVKGTQVPSREIN